MKKRFFLIFSSLLWQGRWAHDKCSFPSNFSQDDCIQFQKISSFLEVSLLWNLLPSTTNNTVVQIPWTDPELTEKLFKLLVFSFIQSKLFELPWDFAYVVNFALIIEFLTTVQHYNRVHNASSALLGVFFCHNSQIRTTRGCLQCCTVSMKLFD